MSSDDRAKLILKLLRNEALFQAPAPGRSEVSEAAFALTRFDAAVKPARCLRYPLIALVIQGEKRAFYGERDVVYGMGQYVVLCHDMPGIYQITGASAVDPFLSVSLRINPQVLLDLSVEYGLTSPETTHLACWY
ncbi:MAG: AraC family transcriptional regulator [Desulfovibrio sp.]|nr:AraC family transcriptional regulator [Desulfovibrio sp.]